MRNCDVCGIPIDPERLEALPDTMTCKAHSSEQKVVGFAFSQFSKGTASEIALVRPENTEAMRQAQRANKRSR